MTITASALDDMARVEPAMFTRIAAIPELRQAKYAEEIDAYPFARVFEGPSDCTFSAPNSAEMLNFASNDYLGLTTDPRVLAAVHAAVDKWGSGCSGSRILNGTNALHIELEEELADFLGKEAAMVTSTGFTANVAALTGLLRSGDWVVADRDIHASLGDGISLSGASVTRFRHNGLNSLQQRIDAVPPEAPVMVVTEGVYSVDGSVSPLPEVAAAAHRRGGAILVDDAHGFGVLGQAGRGAGEHLDCMDDIDLVTLTFSKALASCGGAIAGPASVVEGIRHRATAYLFQASNVPAAVAAALEALRILRANPELAETVRRNGGLLRAAIIDAGWPVSDGIAPIVSVCLPNTIHAVVAWRIMYELGVYSNVQIPPAVPKGRAALRFSAMATHTPAQIERVHEILVETKAVIGRMRSQSSVSPNYADSEQ